MRHLRWFAKGIGIPATVIAIAAFWGAVPALVVACFFVGELNYFFNRVSDNFDAVKVIADEAVDLARQYKLRAEYEGLPEADWFKKVYNGKSLGDVIREE